MAGLIKLKYHIITFFKSDEVAQDMCLLKPQKVLNHLENQARSHHKLNIKYVAIIYNHNNLRRWIQCVLFWLEW